MRLLAFPLITFASLPATIVAGNVATDTLRIAYPPAFQATTRHSSLDSLKAEAERQLTQRFGKHYGCSALSLTALAATLGTSFTERQLRSMSDSFAGGIGHEFSQGTCGALTGAIMALGLYASGDKQQHLKMAKEVYEAFMAQEGTVACGDIYGPNGFSRCNGCNRCAVQKVIEVLYKNGDIEMRTVAPWNMK